MEATCHINFCVIVRVIPRISLQNFMKNIPNLSQEIEKNTEILPKSECRTNEIIGPHEWQKSGSLTITELTKTYRLLLGKFVHFKRSALVFAYVTWNAHYH